MTDTNTTATRKAQERVTCPQCGRTVTTTRNEQGYYTRHHKGCGMVFVREYTAEEKAEIAAWQERFFARAAKRSGR